jgi:hypothetical protein
MLLPSSSYYDFFLGVFFYQISNFGLSTIHSFIYLRYVPSIFPWLLLLFVGCVFAFNKSFILFRSVITDYLWDEGWSGVKGYFSRPE